MDPPGVDGQLATAPYSKPALPVSIRIGGQEADPVYVGAAPGLMSGMLQVNVRVPAGVTGDRVALSLSVGGADSQTGVTLAVR